MDENTLISKVKKGDHEAFRKLIELYQSMVFKTCMGFVHNKKDAEDIAQEVFIKVFSAIKKFREEARFSTWIYRITVNESLNFIRKNKNSTFITTDDLNSLEGYNSNVKTPDKQLEEQQRAESLRTLLNELPKKQRMAFILNKYDDLSYKEIASIMNKSVSSVESLIHRAKTTLTKKIHEIYKKNMF